MKITYEVLRSTPKLRWVVEKNLETLTEAVKLARKLEIDGEIDPRVVQVMRQSIDWRKVK